MDDDENACFSSGQEARKGGEGRGVGGLLTCLLDRSSETQEVSE